MEIINTRTGKSLIQKRRRRYEEAGDARELTFSCYHRYRFLDRDRTRQWFLEELERARRKWSFDLWAYVLMPEQVHLLIHPRGHASEAGKIAGQIKEAVARRAIKYLAIHAQDWLLRITIREGGRLRRRFWQPGGGYDRNVTGAIAAHEMVEYIHANPVRRGLVAAAEDWEWSSARWYAGIRPVAIVMDDTLPVRYETGG